MRDLRSFPNNWITNGFQMFDSIAEFIQRALKVTNIGSMAFHYHGINLRPHKIFFSILNGDII